MTREISAQEWSQIREREMVEAEIRRKTYHLDDIAQAKRIQKLHADMVQPNYRKARER